MSSFKHDLHDLHGLHGLHDLHDLHALLDTRLTQHGPKHLFVECMRHQNMRYSHIPVSGSHVPVTSSCGSARLSQSLSADIRMEACE